ncbi:MAG TPA: porphobilinogen synthase [Steroidobacteraceae bacterium]|jgi:porphobilinogen synthase|nr:porphobilinogen synthase [Steroidobacteraceae bacterium]
MSEPIPLTLRRLRQDEHVRALTREIHVRLDQLIQPCFVAEGTGAAEPVPGLTAVMQETPDSLLRQTEADLRAGVRAFLLFGVPRARAARQIDWSFTAGQIRALKARFGKDIWLAADVCLCSSTPHGHCGVLNAEGDHLDNNASVQELMAAALAYAQAGADCVAPSDMMDGRIGAIRRALDANGLERTVLMSYAVKFQSTLYGPFRVAADSAPKTQSALRDRASYQLDPARPGDAWLCAERDVAEGADILMVKPGLPYLDLLRDLSRAIRKPWAVYHVSGEFAALEALAEKGLAPRAALHREVLTAFKRAGASMIITYGARQARELLDL